MRKFILISAMLFSTTAFAGGNILSLTPHNILQLTPNGANSLLFNDGAHHVDKIDKITKGKLGKPTNKLESSDEFPSADGYFEGPLPEVIFTGELEGGDGEGSGGHDIVEVPLDLERRCACIGNIFVDPIRPED